MSGETPDHGMEALIDTEEAMRILHVSRATFFRLLKGGYLPAIRLGRVWRFRPSRLAQWMEEQEERHQWRVTEGGR